MRLGYLAIPLSKRDLRRGKAERSLRCYSVTFDLCWLWSSFYPANRNVANFTHWLGCHQLLWRRRMQEYFWGSSSAARAGACRVVNPNWWWSWAGKHLLVMNACGARRSGIQGHPMKEKTSKFFVYIIKHGKLMFLSPSFTPIHGLLLPCNCRGN